MQALPAGAKLGTIVIDKSLQKPQILSDTVKKGKDQKICDDDHVLSVFGGSCSYLETLALCLDRSLPRGLEASPHPSGGQLNRRCFREKTIPAVQAYGTVIPPGVEISNVISYPGPVVDTCLAPVCVTG